MKEKPISEEKQLDSRDDNTLVLYNDEYNTFEHVIESLVDICGHNPVQAEQCAVITHYTGSCDIKTGRKKILSSMSSSLLEKKLTSEVK